MSGLHSFDERGTLPKILSAADRARYHTIFVLQREGRWARADHEIAALSSPILLGAVERQRYLHPRYHSKYGELAAWLGTYGDEPGADVIYALALKRRPAGAQPTPPRGPDLGPLGAFTALDADPLPNAPARRTGGGEPAEWQAGLTAWKQHRFDNATQHFTAVAKDPAASVWYATAGAFWAARAAARARHPELVNDLLTKAALYPRTFYGLLAARQLGYNVTFNWDIDPSRYRDFARLTEVPGVRRAIALYEAGEHALAGKEVELLYSRANVSLGELLVALAGRLDAPTSAIKMGESWRITHGETLDTALYPVPPWRPEGGFTVDRALLYSFIRQESAFDAQAVSPAGATGLMQLMPTTASFLAGDSSLHGINKHRLFTPEYNISLGQRYLQQLLTDDSVRGNLLLLAAAYNAGPGSLRRWQKIATQTDDPLLFLETLPVAETRNFVKRVMTGFWLYQERLGQDPQTLDVLAGGKWPYYVAEDDTTVATIDDGRY